jgi:UDP-glucuronate 4-epimerase
MQFIQTIESALGQTAKKNYLPMQPGDVLATYADVNALNSDTGFKPQTPLTEGIARWVSWYKCYTNQ